MSGPYISRFRVHADITIACLRFLLTCRPLISAVVSGATDNHIIKGFYDFFPYVHEFWPDHLLSYSKALIAHPGEHKRIKAVQDLLCRLSNYQTYSAQNVPNPSPGGAVGEDNSIDGESSVLGDFPLAVRQYIAHRKKTPVRQASSTNGTDSNSDLPQTDLSWISAAYRTFQAQFESLLSAANSLNYHQMRAQYCQMTATSDNVHEFKIRHSESAFLCRWSGCIWASAGFQSIAEREKHEMMHTRRFRCSDPNCDFAQNGFSSRHALQKHTLKYHTRTEDLVLPAFPISKSRSEATLENSSVDEDVSENLDFDAFPQAADDGGFQFDAFGNLSHETQTRATFDDSDANAHTQGQAEEKTHSPDSYAANANLVLPESSPDQTPRALQRGNQALADNIQVRLRTCKCFAVVQIQLNQMAVDGRDMAFDLGSIKQTRQRHNRSS